MSPVPKSVRFVWRLRFFLSALLTTRGNPAVSIQIVRLDIFFRGLSDPFVSTFVQFW